MSDVPKKLTQRVRQRVAEQYGMEMTCEEVEVHRKSAHAKIRTELERLGAHGWELVGYPATWARVVFRKAKE